MWCEWEWPCGGFKWVNLWGKDGSAFHAPSEWSRDLISLPRSFSFPWHHLCSVLSLPYCVFLKQRRQRSLPISGSVCVPWLCASGVGGGAGNFPLLAAVAAAAAGSWASTPIQLSAPLGSALPPVRSALRLGGAGQKERERERMLGGVKSNGGWERGFLSASCACVNVECDRAFLWSRRIMCLQSAAVVS